LHFHRYGGNQPGKPHIQWQELGPRSRRRRNGLLFTQGLLFDAPCFNLGAELCDV
jgi:hypothetical protein